MILALDADCGWDFSNVNLIGLNESELWFLSEQIKNHKCLVTDSGYQILDSTYDSTGKFIRRRWRGTVITPGGDRYAMEATNFVEDNKHEFTNVEKLHA